MKKLILIYQREDNFGCAFWDICVPFSHVSAAKATKELSKAYSDYIKKFEKYWKEYIEDVDCVKDLTAPDYMYKLGDILVDLRDLKENSGSFTILTLEEFWANYNSGYKTKIPDSTVKAFEDLNNGKLTDF